MRVPTRRSDKHPREKGDYKITWDKYQKLTKNLEFLKHQVRPQESAEVKELSTTGDYSENAGYQMAKSNLRKTNNKINKIEDILAKAEIINNPNKDKVEIGSLVKIQAGELIKEYQILGSLETNPSAGLISYQSPLGSTLLNKKKGDLIELKVNNQVKRYKILEIT